MTPDESRKLALEISARFTNRQQFTIETMLRNAEKVEEWLNRDNPKVKFVNNNGVNPIFRIGDKVRAVEGNYLRGEHLVITAMTIRGEAIFSCQGSEQGQPVSRDYTEKMLDFYS